MANRKIEQHISYVENYLYAISKEVGTTAADKVEALERIEAICENYLKPLREEVETRKP